MCVGQMGVGRGDCGDAACPGRAVASDAIGQVPIVAAEEGHGESTGVTRIRDPFGPKTELLRRDCYSLGSDAHTAALLSPLSSRWLCARVVARVSALAAAGTAVRAASPSAATSAAPTTGATARVTTIATLARLPLPQQPSPIY